MILRTRILEREFWIPTQDSDASLVQALDGGMQAIDRMLLAVICAFHTLCRLSLCLAGGRLVVAGPGSSACLRRLLTTLLQKVGT